ncbi:hypothetical protein [Amycolatopsis viridis]|uniref:Lantibiotic dehydratase N-terminal domain-containing protein n=1 Tax=Amycolatopsis viridis TaxID=185678 RepID=A0ABX0SYX7_9PSEU|nr:hypothetical protein [Amycolatopsis viridis]NIH82174.1 hypothetical protein [Amycolatopsis viridis]
MPEAALVRVAALSPALAAALGTPDLTERMRHLIRAETAYRACAAEVARRMGDELVPVLPRTLRWQALDVRRRLHRGEVVRPGDLDFPPLSRIVAWGGRLAAETAALQEAVADADRTRHDRMWAAIRHDPEAVRVLDAAAPDVLADVRARLAAGEPWTSRHLRKRGDHLLRLLFRITFGTGPRGRLAPAAPVGGEAVHRPGTGHDDRRPGTAGARPDGWLSLTPLRWTEDDRLCWESSRGHLGAPRRGEVQRTAEVDALCRVLGSRSMRTREVVDLLAPDARRKPLVRESLQHLAQAGLVQVSSAPSGQRHRPPVSAEPGAVVVPARLPELVDHAGRLAAVLTGRRTPPGLGLIGPEPRPVMEIVAHTVDAADPLPAPAWPEPRPRTPYQRLCEWLARHADDREIELGPAVLDYLGAPPAKPSRWPVDCLLRPLPEGRAVLEAVTPAGTMDAWFAAPLESRPGELPPVSAYRAFLVETAARCGAELVEILPPPAGGDATPARGPRYTRTWTGAADPASTVDDPAGLHRYLPLTEITLRREARRVIAEDRSGRELWPLYHGARRPPPPWDLVVSLLTAASPAWRLSTPCAFGDPRAAFPGRTRTPRLLLDRDLVIAPATVFAGRDLLPEPGGDRFARVRALANLRLATGVPRWVIARRGRDSRPVDLDNIATLRVFDRMLADPAVPGLVLEEMLPGPEDLIVSDVDGSRRAARTLVRLPFGTTPADLAERATHAWQQLTRRTQGAAPALAAPRSPTAPPAPSRTSPASAGRRGS